MEIKIDGIKYFIEPEFGHYNFRPFLLTLDDLYVTVHTDEGLIEAPLTEGIVYQTLINNDEKTYTKYHDLINGDYNHNDKHNWDEFMKLKTQLSQEGYDSKRPLLIKYENNNYIIIDGQHRAAILLALGYDDDLLVLRK